MSKEREDQEDLEAETTPADDQPEVSVREDEAGRSVVEASQESRAEKRKRQRMEEMGGLVDSKLKPIAEMLQQLRQQPQPQFQPPPVAAPVKDDVKEAWLKHSRRQEEIVTAMSAARDPSTLERLRGEWHDEEYAKTELVAKKHVPAPVKQEPPEFVVLRSEFPDVLQAGPDVTGYASSLFRQEEIKARRSGKPFNVMDLHRKALTQAAREFGIRAPEATPKPSDAQKARFGGAGPASTGGSSGVAFSRPLSSAEKQMAHARYPKGTPPKKAEEMWAKEMGADYFKE